MLAELSATLQAHLEAAATAACQENGELKGLTFEVGMHGAEYFDGDQYTKGALDNIIRASQDYPGFVGSEVWLWLDATVELGDEVRVTISCPDERNLDDYLVDVALRALDHS